MDTKHELSKIEGKTFILYKQNRLVKAYGQKHKKREQERREYDEQLEERKRYKMREARKDKTKEWRDCRI